MPRVQELIEILSSPTHNLGYNNAKAANTCIICMKPAVVFRNALARLEYECSGICQRCQDIYFRS